jgi:hypothetical protein
MMEHGSPAGLFSVGQFPGAYPCIIDDSINESLPFLFLAKIICQEFNKYIEIV